MSEDNSFLDELKKDFLEEVSHSLTEIEESFLNLEKSTNPEKELALIFRLAHSVKGGGAVVGLTDLAEFAHAFEDLLSILRAHPHYVEPTIVSLMLAATDAIRLRISQLIQNDSSLWDVAQLKAALIERTEVLAQSTGLFAPSAAAPQPAPVAARPVDAIRELKPTLPIDALQNSEIENQKKDGQAKETATIRVESEKVEQMLDQLGELVVIKSQLLQHPSVADGAHSSLGNLAAQLDKVVRDVYDRSLSMRMTALRPLYRKVQRIIRDLSLKLDKQVDFQMIGEATEIDRAMIDILNDPIVHIARNSLDHGLETRGDRIKAGKTEQSILKMNAYHEGGRVIVEISDDGRGIDPKRIFTKAVEKGVLPPDSDFEKMDKQAIVNLIFAPGFSTAEKVTDLSGRGVGLDVVKSNLEKIRGTASVTTAVGKGSLFRLSIPLTSAIVDGMIVVSNQNQFIIPIPEIRELFQSDAIEITKLNDFTEVVTVRDQFIPLLRVSQILPQKFAKIDGREVSRFSAEQSKQVQRGVMIIIERNYQKYALLLERVIGQGQFVIKSLGGYLKNQVGIAGGTIMGDGTIALIIDSEGLIQHANATARPVDIEKEFAA